MENNRLEYFMAFVDISKAISSSKKLKVILNLIIARAKETVGLSAGAISLWNKNTNKLDMIAHINLSDDFLKKGPVFADKSIPRAMKTKNLVVVPDIEYDEHLQYPEACRKEGIKALISIPIIVKDNIIGVFRLYDQKVRKLSEHEIEFLIAVAEQGGIAIENARFISQLKKDHRREMDNLMEWYSDMIVLPGY